MYAAHDLSVLPWDEVPVLALWRDAQRRLLLDRRQLLLSRYGRSGGGLGGRRFYRYRRYAFGAGLTRVAGSTGPIAA